MSQHSKSDIHGGLLPFLMQVDDVPQQAMREHAAKCHPANLRPSKHGQGLTGA